jgi:hypothetical protein
MRSRKLTQERDLSSMVRCQVLRDGVHVVNRPPRRLPYRLGVVTERRGSYRRGHNDCTYDIECKNSILSSWA